MSDLSDHCQLAETSHRVAHVLLGFGAAHRVQYVREVILPTGVRSVEEFYKSRQRPMCQYDELTEEQRRRFPLRRAKFVGSVYDEALRENILYYTCRTDEHSRKVAMLDFDWLCAWCMRRQDLCELCLADE